MQGTIRAFVALGMLAALVLAGMAQAADNLVVTPGYGTCAQADIDTDTTIIWVNMMGSGGLTLDADTSGVVIEIDVCTGTNDLATIRCSGGKYAWDSDGDGSKDKDFLDGDATANQRGAPVDSVSWLRVRVISAASDASGTLDACKL